MHIFPAPNRVLCPSEQRENAVFEVFLCKTAMRHIKLQTARRLHTDACEAGRKGDVDEAQDVDGQMQRVLGDVRGKKACRMLVHNHFERGKDYFERGYVRSLGEHNGAVAAKVVGQRECSVRLGLEEFELHLCELFARIDKN